MRGRIIVAVLAALSSPLLLGAGTPEQYNRCMVIPDRQAKLDCLEELQYPDGENPQPNQPPQSQRPAWQGPINRVTPPQSSAKVPVPAPPPQLDAWAREIQNCVKILSYPLRDACLTAARGKFIKENAAAAPVAAPTPPPERVWAPPAAAAASPVSTASTEASAPPAISAEEMENKFTAILADARQRYADGANDMAKGAARPYRAKALCNLLPGTRVENWAGVVKTLSSNSDGLGVLSIEIGRNMYVTTWNNALSDMQDKTLLNPESPLFKKAIALNRGQKVRFSGSFVRSTGTVDCVRESSMTLDGSMTSPEFIFRFADIEPL